MSGDERAVSHQWPRVVEKDDGIRPAGPPDQCLYCRQNVGQPHKLDCVTVVKRVRVTYEITVDLIVPHHWDKEAVEFHRNEGSWCGSNVVEELEAIAKEAGVCLCSNLACKFVEVVDDTPRRASERRAALHPQEELP